MGKFTYAVLMVFTIELALYIFTGTEYATTTLFDMLLDPSTLIANPLYILFGVSLVVFGASAIIPGTFYQNQISFMYLSIAVAFLSFSMSIVHLWTFINGELSGLGLGNLISLLIISPILIYYIIATTEWVRSN